MTDKGRITYIDNLKGFLILLVILCHCVNGCKNSVELHLWGYIYSFHMPLFVAVSGFVHRRDEVFGWSTVRRRAQQLLVPFFAVNFLYGAYYGNWLYFIQKIAEPIGDMWYLWTLFFIIVTFKLSHEVAKRARLPFPHVAFFIAAALMALVAVFKLRWGGIHFVAWHLPFFCVGYFGRRWFENTLKLKGWQVAALLIIYSIGAWFWKEKLPPTFMDADSGRMYNYIYKYAMALTACVLFPSIFRMFINRCNALTRLGRNTLGIYVVQQYAINLLWVVAPAWLICHIDLQWSLFFIFATIISVIAVKLLKLTPVTSFLFLGQPLRQTAHNKHDERRSQNR